MSDIATLVLAGGVRCQGVAIPPSGRQCFVFVAEAEWRAALVNTSAAIPLMSSASSSRPRPPHRTSRSARSRDGRDSFPVSTAFTGYGSLIHGKLGIAILKTYFLENII